MRIENHKDHLLFGALGIRRSVARLDLQPGVYQCKIQVKTGILTLRHYSYDLQIGAWCSRPEDGDEAIRIQEGESRIVTIHCGVHDGQADEICISNESWVKKVSFHIDLDEACEKEAAYEKEKSYKKENSFDEEPMRKIA